MLDRYDLLILTGLLLLGIAVWDVLGWPGLLGYGGGVCLVIGLAGAARGQRGPV